MSRLPSVVPTDRRGICPHHHLVPLAPVGHPESGFCRAQKRLPGPPAWGGEAARKESLTAVPGPRRVHDVQDVKALVGRVLGCPADAGQEAAPIRHPGRASKRHGQRSVTWSSTLGMLSRSLQRPRFTQSVQDCQR